MATSVDGASDPSAPQQVFIGAAHGSLECGGRHVMIGHFLGTPIGGSEAFIDDRLGRRLTTRQLLGQYPERLGDAIVVDHPKVNPPGYPPGAIVIGLDLPGELTRDKLKVAVSAGLVCYAIRVLEAQPASGDAGPPELLEVAAVPIGTNGVGAISVEGCVSAMVDGVTMANEAIHACLFRGRRAWDCVRIAGLEIIEVLSDKAERAAHAVRRARDLAQVDVAGHSELVLGDHLMAREGGLPAALSGPDQAGDWQRIIIRNPRREGGSATPGDTTSVLEFTAIGRRARSDALQVTLDIAAIERIVEGAVRDARPDRQVGNTLYELLLPNELKIDLARSENLQFIVDENTADLPWETLTARFGGQRAPELVLRGGFLRQFRETEQTRQGGRTPVGRQALVIGNPPPPPGLAPLAGAGREAAAVAAALAPSFEVSALVWDEHGSVVLDTFPDQSATTGRRVLDALFSQDWRILHIAAHGRFEPGRSSASGVVIDAETTITANVVRQLSAVPELVFLNCCHLGRVDGRVDGRPGGSDGPADRNRLAASVARELMGLGVQAVIAAGWAVDDSAAVVFAQTFYEQLLGGAFFGAAVQAARERVSREPTGCTTWAAFQCYGDPGFHLFGGQSEHQAVPHLASPDELVRRVRTIAVLAGKIGLPDFDELSERDQALVAELDGHRLVLQDRRWATAVVLHELGAAYSELGAYEQAVDCFRQAWDQPDSSAAPVKLLEQLGNLEVRLAQRRFRADPSSEVADLVGEARRHLELALGLGQTPERLAMIASFHKKAATLATRSERSHHVAEAARLYGEARAQRVRVGDRPIPYHTLNWLQLRVLAGAPVPGEEAGAALEAIIPSEGWDAEDFWRRVRQADMALTRHLVGDSTDIGPLKIEYCQAFDTRASRSDRDTVVDHLRDLAELYDRDELHELARYFE